MNYIWRYFIRMVTFLALMIGVLVLLRHPLEKAFQNNIPLNTSIGLVLIIGIILVFYRLYSLNQEQKWFDSYQQREERFPGIPEPKILLPLSLALAKNPHNQPLPTLTFRSILSSIDARLEETREVPRYLIGLLIFLGLLGTFWGLSQTIGAVAGVITDLDVDTTNIKDSFSHLKQGLQAPLTGMGTAFSTSLFGLASSLILGFLDLQVNKAASILYHSLEEYLSTAPSTADLLAPSPVVHSGPAYLQSLLEKTTECMAQLQSLMSRNEDNRSNVLQTLHIVGDKISMLTEHMVTQQNVLKKMAQGQVDLQKQLEYFISLTSTPHNADDGVKQYLRNLDATTLRLLEELIEGRASAIQELKSEIRLVAKTISALAEHEAS